MPQLRPSTAKEKEVTRSHSSRLIASVSWEFGMGSLRLPWLSAGASRGDRELLCPAVVASCSPELSLDPWASW